MTPLQVISGGQDGVDVAALRAAKRAGLLTGGWMPKGFLTLSGPRPEYREEYGMKEHPSPFYPPRTYDNVKDADFTLRLARDWKSPGERCTLNAIHRWKKKHLDLNLDALEVYWLDHLYELLAGVRVLNVAGNTPRTAGPDVEVLAEPFLFKVFCRWKEAASDLR